MIQRINFRKTLPIRQIVLWPKLTIDELYVKGDEDAIHYGYFINKQVVGVISLFDLGDEFQFRKFAVLPEHQNKGIGSTLLQHVMESIDKTIKCNARVSATELYEKFGMEIVPNSAFSKGNVQYVIMKKEF